MVASNVQVTQSSSRLVSNIPKLAILEIMSPLYIATKKNPIPSYLTWQKHANDQQQSPSHGSMAYTEKANANRTEPSDLGAHGRDQTFINSQHDIFQLLRIGAEAVWLRNYHLV
jgi:hypothetical protein